MCLVYQILSHPAVFTWHAQCVHTIAGWRIQASDATDQWNVRQFAPLSDILEIG